MLRPVLNFLLLALLIPVASLPAAPAVYSGTDYRGNAREATPPAKQKQPQASGTQPPPTGTQPPANGELPPNIRHISMHDGLPTNQVLGCLIDNQGLLWIQTQSGLCVYDGQSLDCDLNISPILGSGLLIQDRRGRLWWYANDTPELRLYFYDGQQLRHTETFRSSDRPHHFFYNLLSMQGVMPGQMPEPEEVAAFLGRIDQTQPPGMFLKKALELGESIPDSLQRSDLLYLYLFRKNRHLLMDRTRQICRVYSQDWHLLAEKTMQNDKTLLLQYLLQYFGYREPLEFVRKMDFQDDFDTDFGGIHTSQWAEANALIGLARTPRPYFLQSDLRRAGFRFVKKTARGFETIWDKVPESTRHVLLSAGGEAFFSSDKGLHILRLEAGDAGGAGDAGLFHVKNQGAEAGRLREPGLAAQASAGEAFPPDPPEARGTRGPAVLVAAANGKAIRFDRQHSPELRSQGPVLELKTRLAHCLMHNALTEYSIDGGEWRAFDAGRGLRLDNMPHGTHHIRLRALAAGTKNPEITTVRATVSLPLWERTNIRSAALALTALLLLTGGWLLYRRYHRRQKLRSLETQINRTKLMTVQTQLNPHFLFNAMISLQNSIRNKSSEEAQDQLQQLSALIRKVLVLNKRSEDRAELSELLIPLEEEITLLRDYVELENKQRDPRFTFHIDIDPAVLAGKPSVPPLMLQPFVENAIIHGISAIDRGAIFVKIKREGEWIDYLIEDNGIGRRQAETLKQQRSAHFKSRGGEILRKRFELLRALGYKTKLSISDRDGGGTSVNIKAPPQLNIHF